MSVRSGLDNEALAGFSINPEGAFLSKAESRQRAEKIAWRLVAEQHDRPSLVSRIACEVAAEVVEDIRQPGTDLNSVELARRYKTSRTPIREALMLLEKEGLVEMPPRRRPRVADLTIKEIRDIYRVRANLLELIAGDIARETPLEDIRTLKPMLEAMEASSKVGDVNAFFWANVDFHERNTELASNRTVKKIIDSLLLRTLRLRRIGLSQPGRLHQSSDDHERLYRAYENRDSNLAAALIRSNHISGLAVIERIYLSQGTFHTG
ncbi:GntR family transcriptional regulator [Mesorhizobium sp. BR1-1-2]|uniref:GntR family transcriptional regulator n=1 Tax=Mesorhizobium sp. BR1-1-2 TaxID=2876652 RepID=UPI001CCEB379|nr:GntR family transcriptional regulator [Mesorhizobium sp. BR1-1-2]MBZ9965862.1 GntR family transcriptional regulator [Mesorhizobium sp. BR1-1-2]